MLVITGRAVRTGRGTIGNAILVAGGLILEVGEADRLRRRGLESHDHPEGYLLPGIRDAHFHPVAYAAAVTGLAFDSASSIADVLDAVATAHGQLEPMRALVGLRLDDQRLVERRLPTAAELTRVTGDRPVLLHRYCGHVAVANQAALARAGIDRDTADPPGGIIDRDERGAATGPLRETAVDIVARVVSDAEPVTAAQTARALRGLAAHGITSIGAMVRHGEGAWASLAADEAEIVAEAASRIPLKVRAYVIADEPRQLVEAGSMLDDAGPRARWQGLKRFADGSLGGHTAAMRHPYSDEPTRGTLRLGNQDSVLARAAIGAGKDVAIHAIGDLACREVVDLFAQLHAEGVAGSRLRIEHASVIQGTDRRRLAAIGAAAVVQPPFLGSESGWLAERVGNDRLMDTYAFRSMLADGVTLAGSSDCPVESPDPWSGMALARDRSGLQPDESLDPASALAMYTTGGARALGEPEPLAPGSPADVVVVDRDPVEVDPEDLRQTRVIATYIDGRIVDAGDGPAPWPGRSA